MGINLFEQCRSHIWHCLLAHWQPAAITTGDNNIEEGEHPPAGGRVILSNHPGDRPLTSGEVHASPASSFSFAADEAEDGRTAMQDDSKHNEDDLDSDCDDDDTLFVNEMRVVK